MNKSEERLSKAFREIAAIAPQNPSEEVRLNLKRAFQRHHIRRRRIRAIGSIAAIAVCFALVALIALKGTRLPVKHGATGAVAVKSNPQQSPSPSPGTISDSKNPIIPKHKAAISKRPPVMDNHTHTSPNIAKGFTPLPSYVPGIPASGYQIVRVGLQETALSQLGLPVHENNSGQRVVTDLLVDRDGMPMAYRFVGALKTR